MRSQTARTASLKRSLLLAFLTALCMVPVSKASDSLLHVLHQAHQGIHRFELDNGLNVLVKPVHAVPVVSIQIWVGTGSIHEDEFLGSGLSHYVEHMYFKGTDKLSTGDIWQQISGPGGQMNAYTTLDRTVFYTDMPSSHWKQGLNVLGEAAMHASFPEDEWEREKEVILREMAMGEDNPDRVLMRLLSSTAIRKHPMRHPVIGYRDVFTQRDRDDLMQFFQEHYVPDNMMLVLVGDVEPDAVETEVRELFSDFERTAREPVVLPDEPAQLSPREARKTGEYQISRLGYAWHTVPLTHPDAPALDVLAEALGSGRSSILTRILKEEQGLALSLSAWSYTPASHGVFGLTLSCLPDREEELVTALEDLLYSDLASKLTEADIEKAARRFLSQQIKSMETINGQARSIASGAFYTGDPEFSVRYLEQIRSVTAEDLQRVIDKYLRPSGRTRVVLAPEGAPSEAMDADRSQLQPVQRVETAAGVPLLVREDRRLPKVYFCVLFGGGVITETKENAGITELMSQLLTRGTEQTSAAEIANLVEGRGGQISGFSGNHSFGLTASCLSDDAQRFADLIRECILEPTFPTSEMERQAERQAASIRASLERPAYHAVQTLRDTIFGDHPFSRDPSGTLESVGRLTQTDVQAYYRDLAVRENAVLAVFGDIDAKTAETLMSSLLDGLPSGRPPSLHADATAQSLPDRAVQELPFQQAVLMMGYPGVALTDPRSDALTVLDTAMSGLASDLGIEVREKRGLVYYVGSSQMLSVDPGFFYFYAGTRNDALDEVEHLIREQVKRVQVEGLRDEELSRAQNQLENRFYTQLQDNRVMAQTSAIYERVGGGFEQFMNQVQRYRDVTQEDVQDVTRDLLAPDKTVVSVVRSETDSE